MLGSAEAVAQSGTVSSRECCLGLLFPLGARAVSLGQSLTARPSVDGVFFNPASLADGKQDRFVVHHEKTFEGQNNAFTLLVDAGLIGAFGFTYLLIDQGDSEATDEFNNPTGTLSAREQQLVASFATPIAAGLRAGLSYKLFSGGLFCTTGSCNGIDQSGTTHMLDMGLQFRPPVLRSLELGAAITHFGFALQQHNAEQADPTPARFRLGAAYEFAHHFRADSAVKFWVSADVVNRLRSPTAPIMGVGAELVFDGAIFVRAGYSGSGDALTLGGGGVGVGIRYQRYAIDVAKLFTTQGFETEGEPFQVSFGITF